MKKKILLLTVAMLSATTAYSMCYPEIKKGTKENPCHCQFPVFDGKELSVETITVKLLEKNVWMMEVVVNF